jgi:ABC-type uncharacterized transport system substrate-binding protein
VKFIALAVLLLVNTSVAQRNKVPVDLQLKVIPKIISLNKTFSLDTKDNPLKIAVLYSSQQRNSKQVFEDIEKNLKTSGLVVKGNLTKVSSFDISVNSDIGEYLRENKINVLYITPLRGLDVSKITGICKTESVLTISGVVEYLESNVSVLLDIEDNKLQILINQKSAKGEGADFSSRLLRIAKIVE